MLRTTFLWTTPSRQARLSRSVHQGQRSPRGYFPRSKSHFPSRFSTRPDVFYLTIHWSEPAGAGRSVQTLDNENALKYKVLTIVLLVANLVTAGMLIHARWQNHQWEDRMYGMAGYASALQCSADFRAGRFRVFEVTERGDLKYTGKKDGPFEVWTRPYYPILGHPSRFTEDSFAKSYNDLARYKYRTMLTNVNNPSVAPKQGH